MPQCQRCGSWAVLPSGLCQSCGASSQAHLPEDVPCQRCGMYLPEHELKMWNSRLYCAYCIMDIQDEEDLLHRRHSKPERHSGSEGREQEFGKEKGACERCGRQSDALYQHLGKKLCASCHSDSKSPPGEGHAPFGVFLQQQLVGSARQFAAGLGSPKKAILPDGQRNPKRKSIWERIFSFFGLRK